MIDGRRGRAAGEQDSPSDPAAGPALSGTSGDASHPPSSTRRLLPRFELGRRLHAIGVTADQVTVVGILIAALTGTMIALGHLWIGVALVTTGGLMDTLDGAVAKAAGTSSRRGAFLDSVSDRVADGFIFGGLALYFAVRATPALALLPFAILAVGNVISYERAKAELYGWNGKGGLMERAERLIGLGIALGFNIVLVPLLWALLGLCVFTAAQRFGKIWRQATAELNGEPVVAIPAAARPAAAWRPARVESRFRTWREAQLAGAARRRPARTTRASSRRRAATGETLSTRLRSVLATERSTATSARHGAGPGSTGTTRALRATRAERLSRRRNEGAAAALRRRLGTGR